MTFHTIHPKDVKRLQKERGAVIVDIRTRKLYQRGHADGAVCIPYDDDAGWEPALSKHRPVILYCEHGGSSMSAGRALGERGYEVYAVIGGYEAMKKITKSYFKN